MHARFNDPTRFSKTTSYIYKIDHHTSLLLLYYILCCVQQQQHRLHTTYVHPIPVPCFWWRSYDRVMTTKKKARREKSSAVLQITDRLETRKKPNNTYISTTSCSNIKRVDLWFDFFSMAGTSCGDSDRRHRFRYVALLGWWQKTFKKPSKKKE